MTPVDAHRGKRPHSEASEGTGQRNLGEREGGRPITGPAVSRLLACGLKLTHCPADDDSTAFGACGGRG
jgi:hypothetical protein